MQGRIRKDLVFIKCVIFERLPTSELLYAAIPPSHFIQIILPNASSLTQDYLKRTRDLIAQIIISVIATNKPCESF